MHHTINTSACSFEPGTSMKGLDTLIFFARQIPSDPYSLQAYPRAVFPGLERSPRHVNPGVYRLKQKFKSKRVV